MSVRALRPRLGRSAGPGVEGTRRDDLPGGPARRDRRLRRRPRLRGHRLARGHRRVRVPRPVRLVATARPGRRRRRAGEYDVILVWKYSRVARHRLRWAVAIDRVETPAAGWSRPPSSSTPPPAPAGSPAACSPSSRPSRPSGSARSGRTSTSPGSPPASPPPGSRSGATSTTAPRSCTCRTRRPGPVLADLYRRYVAGESVYPGAVAQRPRLAHPRGRHLVGPVAAPGPRLRVRLRPVHLHGQLHPACTSR
jgi:hypothetical protein